MNHIVEIPILWANENGSWFAFRSDFTDQPVDLGPVARALLILVFCSLVFGVLFRLVNHWACRRCNSPTVLFLSLCRAHRLTWRQSWLLWRTAAAHGLHHPARIFLEMQWYDAAELPKRLQNHATELSRLRSKLFDLDDVEGFGGKMTERGPIEQQSLTPKSAT